jgi:hypothetical protein
MPTQSEHTRQVLTRSGYRNILVNEGFQRVRQPSSQRKRRPSLQSALEQMGGAHERPNTGTVGGPAAKTSLVMAISGQEERIAATAYGFREIADDLADGKLSVADAQSRSRETLVEMETHMAAVEYAAGRISAELADAVASNHENVRDRAIDSIGYLLDMDESPTLHDGDFSVNGFREIGAEPVYDASRAAVEVLQISAAQEVAAQFLPEAAADLEYAFRAATVNDPESMVRYHEAGKELFGVTRTLRDMESEITGETFHTNQMMWVVEEMDRVVHSGGSRDATVEDLWSAIDSFQGGFGLMVDTQPAA